MRHRRNAVFLGPSCPQAEALHCLPDADYYPPAARGSFYAIINHGYETIVLLDGLFYSQYSVWHKEIMFALDSGIRVIGASSMGALRAAELPGTGMEGVGKIFSWYRDKVIDGDDEVALLHESAAEGFSALTLPLVNLRWNLDRAVDQGVVSAGDSAALIANAKRLCFVDRTMETLLATAQAKVASELAPWLDGNWQDLKQLDAIEALQLAALGEGRLPTQLALRPYELVHINVGLEAYVSERLTSITAKSDGCEVALAAFVAGIDAKDDKYRDFLRARRCQRLIVGWARELRFEPSVAAGEAGVSTPHLEEGRRRAVGLTRIDAARESRDTQLLATLIAHFCSDAIAEVLAELDAALAADLLMTGFDTEELIVLDGRLVFTLWALGKRKGLTRGLQADTNSAVAITGDDPPSAADVMMFVEAIEELGVTRLGYGFDPAREILFAYQALDRLEAIVPSFDVEIAA